MNQFVPEFDMEDDNSIPPPSSGSLRQKSMKEDEILELLWQNGQVVVQSQNPRLHNKSSPPPTKCMHHNQQEPEIHQPPPSQPPTMPCDATTHLIMQEEEMVSWLQYPLVDSSFDRDLNELLYPPPGPPLPPAYQVPFWPEPPGTDINVPHFSGTTTIFPESAPSTSSRNNELRESMVDSCDTPAIRQKSKIPIMTRNAIEMADRGHRLRESFTGVGGSEIGGTSMAGGGGGASTSFSKDIDTCDLPLTSSPGCSAACASFSATATGNLMVLPPGEDRKRKGREQVDEANTELQSQDVDIESYEPMKQTRGATIKRSRAAEVHNLSERKRRDRINEKMRALQDLIPQSTKTDKASMLDEAIDYMKSLQMQIQSWLHIYMMMSMGCGMVPVMFPGVQQYMSSMGLGMGMEMGMARPMMQFPGGVSGQSMPTLGAPSHMHPRFPFQAFQMPHISGTDPSRIQQATNPQHAFQQMQIPQNQPNPQPSSGKPSTSRASKDKGKENPATG